MQVVCTEIYMPIGAPLTSKMLVSVIHMSLIVVEPAEHIALPNQVSVLSVVDTLCTTYIVASQ